MSDLTVNNSTNVSNQTFWDLTSNVSDLSLNNPNGAQADALAAALAGIANAEKQQNGQSSSSIASSTQKVSGVSTSSSDTTATIVSPLSTPGPTQLDSEDLKRGFNRLRRNQNLI